MRPYGPDTGRPLCAIQNEHKKITNVTTFYYSGITIIGESDDQVRLTHYKRLKKMIKKANFQAISVECTHIGRTNYWFVISEFSSFN
ncbi:MAG: hypothetical protein EZS28_034692 [Streblomastix strix]|uniref:Uncharacterized protein n=1 Tax=Streblomastix strix TaxID=222440 RepID=A0A5J4UIC7_9EUKA|nr:MAG: hypothetical protein EZS28_034692 [Streblomastix strix]